MTDSSEPDTNETAQSEPLHPPTVNAGPDDTPGPIYIIGGSEDKDGERRILRAFAAQLAGRKLVLVTVASHEPDGYLKNYELAFEGFGVTEIVELYVHTRGEMSDPEKLELLDGAGGIFFSGGDQLRLSSLLTNTPVQRKMRHLWLSGAVLAGTSAGASVLSDFMPARGPSKTSHRTGDLDLAPGLGMLRNVVIDQHFAERGRFGRLIGAVTMSPRVLGIGVDEDTALVVEDNAFHVVGSGAVYLFDGSAITWSSVADNNGEVLSVHDMRVHVLAEGDTFDFTKRRPIAPTPKETHS